MTSTVSAQVARYSSLFVATLLASSALGSTAFAQIAPNAPPPLNRTVDAFGVDMLSGTFRYSLTEGTSGSGEGAVSLVRHWGDGGFRDNWSNGLYVPPSGTAYVMFGDISEAFTISGTTYTSQSGNGSTLVANSSGYLFTSRDGTKIQYFIGGLMTLAGTACAQGSTYCAIPATVTKPNGMVFNINWDTVDKCADFECTSGTTFYRFAGVSSSAGYAVNVTYLTDFPGNMNNLGAPQSNWYVKTGAAFTNNVTACASECQSVTYAAPSTQVTTITDAMSRQWRLDWTGGKLVGIRRPGEAADSTSVTYSGTSQIVTSVTDHGVTLNYARSVSGNTVTATITDPLTKTKVVTGDLAKGQITSVKDENNLTTSYGYDTQGRLTGITKPEGDGIDLVLDTRGNATQIKSRPKTGSASPLLATTYTYPASCANPITCNKPTKIQDPASNATDITYDTTHGGVLTVTSPAPTTGAVRPQVRYSYTLKASNVVGEPGVYLMTGVSECQTTASCAGALDETRATIAYNAQMLPSSVTRASGTGSVSAATTATYDAAGNLLTTDGPLSGAADTTRYRYNQGRELVGVTSPDPDGAGTLRPRAMRLTIRPDGQVSKRELGTVNSQSDADWALFAAAQTVDVTYNSNARRATAKLSNGATAYALTQTSYDALGRVDCSATRMSPTVYGSLPASACTLSTQGTNGPDQISKAIYDNASRVIQVQVGVGTTAAATERTLTWTNNGQVATLKDGENNLTTYEYDEYDRPWKMRHPNPTKGAGTSSTTDYEQLTYDNRGNVTARRLRDGTSIAFTYDNLNRATLKNLPGTEPDVSFGYDNLGRLTSASQTGNALSFTYDALSRNLTQVGPQGTVTSEWDAAGRRTKITYPGAGLFVNYDYLITGEVTKIRENNATSGAGVLATYTYDNLGNRTKVTFGNNVVQDTPVDLVSRLASLSNDLPGTTNDLSATFGYAPSSQIKSTSRTGNTYAFGGYVNVNRNYTSNGRNQYSAAGTASFTYDGRGNLTNDGTSAFGYSSESLLTSGPGVTLGYDAFNRLYQVTGVATTRFTYDGLNMIMEYDGSNALQRRHVFAPGLDRPIATYEGATVSSSTRRFLSADERGSIISVTDNAGAVIAINRYDEYGIPGSTNYGRFGYTGQAWIPELGMNYYKARIYSPTLGRFMQSDPIGQADNANLYAYVSNDPVNGVDPLGLMQQECHYVVSYTYTNPWFPDSNTKEYRQVCAWVPDDGDFRAPPGNDVGRPWEGPDIGAVNNEEDDENCNGTLAAIEYVAGFTGNAADAATVGLLALSASNGVFTPTGASFAFGAGIAQVVSRAAAATELGVNILQRDSKGIAASAAGVLGGHWMGEVVYQIMKGNPMRDAAREAGTDATAAANGDGQCNL